MNRIIFVVPILVLAIGAIAGFAQPSADDPAPEDFDWLTYSGEGDTTAEMERRCLEGYEALGKRLEEVLQLLYDIMDDEGDALLRQNQEDWQAYALSKRTFDGDVYRGGSLSRIVVGQSYVAELQRRIKELLMDIENRQPL